LYYNSHAKKHWYQRSAHADLNCLPQGISKKNASENKAAVYLGQEEEGCGRKGEGGGYRWEEGNM
jgi:hypothetical protein